MKYLIATAAAALLLSIATTPSIADDQSSDPTRHTMGDSGKLPASGAVSGHVPDMGAGTGTGAGTVGSSHRMGDEGKLPATNSMSNEVPKMHKPSDDDK